MKLLLASIGLALITAAPTQAQEVRIATQGAYAPWNFTDETGALEGFEIDLANEICLRADLDCTLVQTPWVGAFDALLAGDFDVIMSGVAITPDRMTFLAFSSSYYPAERSLFVHAADRPIDFDDIAGLRLGAQTGTIHADYIEENYADRNEIVLYDVSAIAGVENGEIDVALANETFLDPIIADAERGIVAGGEPIELGEGVGAAFRPDEEELIAAFDQAIAAMKADGTLNALIVRWFDNPRTFD